MVRFSRLFAFPGIAALVIFILARPQEQLLASMGGIVFQSNTRSFAYHSAATGQNQAAR